MTSVAPRRLVLAGLFLLTSGAGAGDISGRVFRDANRNGVPDPGEDGVAAALEVFGTRDAGGTLDQTLLGAADGTVAPALLDDGCYLLRLTPPPGFRLGPVRSDCPGAGRGFPVGTRRYASGRHLIDALRGGALLHVALGDSIAEPASFCALGAGNNATDYVGPFGQRLRCVGAGAAGIVTENHAIGGKRATDLLLPAGTCGPPNLPHGGGDRCDNLFDAIARDPQLVSISIGGNDWLGTEPNDQTEPFDAAEVQRSIDALLDTRKNLQEILSTLASELPAADVLVNTVYDNRAANCASSDFHDIWIPIWDQMLRDVTWGQGDRFSVAEIHPEYAHQDLNGQSCCGERQLICLLDGIHPTVNGSKIHLEKVWEAAGGVNLGPRDPLTTRSNPDLVFPLTELVATRFASQVVDLTGGTANPQAALQRDDTGASLPAGDGEFELRGFDAAPAGIVPTQVVVAVRYRTDSAPPPPPERDAYAFEASVDGGFSPPQYAVTGWNTVVPIVGAGGNAPTRNALPDVPRWREARALLTRNLLDDGRARGAYAFPPMTWPDIATLAVRFRGTTAGAGRDAYRVELDSAWIEVYGVPAPRAIGIYRSLVASGLISPGNLVTTVAAPPYDDATGGGLLFFAAADGSGAPAIVSAVKHAVGIRLTW